MKTQAQIEAGLRLSAANAARLKTIGIAVRIKDAVTDEDTVTTSLPWQLGHGEWVVKVKGKSGGWCCSMLEVLESEVAA